VAEDGTGASIADLETALAKAQKKGTDAAVIAGLEARLAALLQLQPKEGETVVTTGTTGATADAVVGEGEGEVEEKSNMKSSKAEDKAELKAAKKVSES
jgi:hypothetical protein